MSQLHEDFLTRLELSKYIVADMSNAEKINMLDKYEKLATSIINKSHGSVFNNDAENYCAILNDQVFNTFMKGIQISDLSNYPNLKDVYDVCRNSALKVMSPESTKNDTSVKNKAFSMMHRELCRKIAETGMQVPNGILDTNSVQIALQTFGLKKSATEPEIVTPEDVAPTTNTGIEFDDELENEFNNYMNGEAEDTYEEDEETKEDEEGTSIDLSDLDGIFDDKKIDTEATVEQTNDSEQAVKQESEVEMDTDPVDESEPEVKIDTELTEAEKEKLAYFEAFKQVYEGVAEGSGTPLRSAIDGIMMSLHDLYMSCFSGITAPDGILTHKGLLSLDKIGTEYKFVYNHTDIDLNKTPVTDPKYIKYKTNSSEYNKRYKAVMYALGVALGHADEISIQSMNQSELTECIENAVRTAEAIFGKAIDMRKSALPKYADAQAVNYYPKLHTEFMTGNFNINEEMLTWATKNKVHRNAYKITNFDDLMKWARIRVSNCLTQALIDAGLKIEDAGYNDADVTSICQIMAKKIKNIIVITNSRKSHFTLKICTSQVVNGSVVEKCVKDYFNAASAGSKSTSVVIKNSGGESGVIELDVVMDMDDYNASSRMSADVIDSILETGNVPSWSNAILGEKNNGGAFNYNFKDKYALAIYGASGSGKGIMTSALLTNAMAEGCALLYIDGKPDNGAALGKVAWDKGFEAPVFNGITGKLVGGGCPTWLDGLEDYSHGKRDLNRRFVEIDKIPMLEDKESWPFGPTRDEDTKEIIDPTGRTNPNRVLLYEVSLTLKAFQLAHDIIIKRAQGGSNLERLPNNEDDRWAVIIIDEIEDAACNEQTMRDLMKDYMKVAGEREIYKTEINSKGEQVQKKDGKVSDPKNWSKDPGYLFCKQWLNWVDSLCLSWSTVVKKSLRGSRTTLITIFQKNEWFKQTGVNSAGSTKIGTMMLALSSKVIRVVGRGALSPSTNAWGDKTFKEYTWGDEVNKKAKWAIGRGEGLITDEATVFKPFKVFTTDLGDGVPVPTNDIGAGSKGCWESKEDKYNSNKKRPMGLQSYLTYMFNGLQDELQEQLRKGQRLEGTLTPEGVLQTSFDYFNRLCGGNLIESMYIVPPIANFTGSIDEAEAQQISQSEEQSAQSDLDALNSTLGNHGAESAKSNPLNNQEQEIDFGFNSQGPSPIPGKQVNSTGPAAAPTQHQSMFEQAKLEEQQMKSIKAMLSTQKLRLGNFEDRVLDDYYRRILNRGMVVENNLFDYRSREKRPTSLMGAAITLSNLCYMALERGVYPLNELRTKAMNQIKSLNDPQDKWKFMLGMIDDYCSNTLNYDDMPSVEQLRGYQTRYGASITPDSGYAYNENGANQQNSGNQSSNTGGASQAWDEPSNTGDWDTSQENGDNTQGTDYNTPNNQNNGYNNQANAADSWGENSFNETDGSMGNPVGGGADYDRMQRIIEENKAFDMDMGNGSSSFQTNNRTGSTIINPSPDDDVVRLDADSYIEEKSQKWRTFERFKRTLFETSNGTAYEFKSRWDFILKKIGERYPDRALVRKLAFTEMHVIVNNKMIVLNDLIGGEADITVVDLLRIRDTFKKFPFIQSMTFDRETTQCLIDEYGTTAQELWNIFRENRALKVIEIDTPTQGQMQIRREAIQSMVNQINEAMGARVAQMQYEQYGSSFNPRLENKSPGYTERMQKNKKSKASSWFQSMPVNKKMSPKVKKRLKWGGATLGVLALGAVIGVPGLIATGVGSAIGFFRGRN